MTPTRRQTFLEIERTGIARWEAIKRLILVAAIGVTLVVMLVSCTSQQPKPPDPFDTALNSFVSQMFDTEGNPKP